jgi:hypothetical protein
MKMSEDNWKHIPIDSAVHGLSETQMFPFLAPPEQREKRHLAWVPARYTL